MTTNRRDFLTSVSAAGLCGTGLVSSTQTAAQDAPGSQRPLDYGLSFICGTAAFNAVRFWVESRTTIVDPQAGTSTVYYQCASCKSENTFAPKDLFYPDNYDFLPILGDGRWLVFRRKARITDNYRSVGPVEEFWGAPAFKLKEAAAVTVLDTFEKIRDATAGGAPIVAQTELSNVETGLRATIEYPVKTMNVSLTNSLYQVDTGPIAYPDLSKRFDPQIQCLSLAFVAFNAPHFADFVVEQPTAVVEDGQEKCKVFHYSAPFSLPAKNTVLAIGAT